VNEKLVYYALPTVRALFTLLLLFKTTAWTNVSGQGHRLPCFHIRISGSVCVVPVEATSHENLQSFLVPECAVSWRGKARAEWEGRETNAPDMTN